MIPYGKQEILQEDIKAAVDVLNSDFLTQGPVVGKFEQAIAQYCGVKYGVAVNSGTSALHIACLSLGIGVGDVVWTTPITFVASANCVRYCGADVDFVDIDPNTYNMSVVALEQKLSIAKIQGNLPKAVIPVHMCGQSCEMDKIKWLSEKYGFFIIEDASHAVGAKYKNNPVGSCKFSDIAVFSFHPVKIITTAEGGMALTNNKILFEKMNRLRSHGITRNPDHMIHEPDGAWYYQQVELGFNYRMTEIQAAIGISQLKRLDAYVANRHKIAEKYNKFLDNLPVKTPYCQDDAYSSFHLYIIRLHLNEIKKTYSQVFDGLRSVGVGVHLHYIPVHTQPYYRKLGFHTGDFPEAERYYQEALTLPLYPTLTDAEIEYIVHTLYTVILN